MKIKDRCAIIITIISILGFLYTQIFYPKGVSGDSMSPTINNDSYVLMNRSATILDHYNRNDIVVFVVPINPHVKYIKRVIGIAGDIIKIKDQDVYLNGKILKEPYINKLSSKFEYREEEITVKENTVFVMGDNREYSSDSRDFGLVDCSSILSKVYFTFPTYNKLYEIKKI